MGNPCMKSTYAKVHGSVSVNALHRKEAEESACGKVHDPAFENTSWAFTSWLWNFLLIVALHEAPLWLWGCSIIII